MANDRESCRRKDRRSLAALRGRHRLHQVSRLDFRPEAPLFVEIHGAFAEPKGLVGGRPILKSKINLVANDMIRETRRELAKKREK